MRLHGGAIEAHNAGRGQGCEFVVKLPLAGIDAGSAVDEVLPSAIPPHLKLRRVLVVDDNHDAADSLAMLLQLLGAQVEVAHDGRCTAEAGFDYHLVKPAELGALQTILSAREDAENRATRH